MSPSHIPEIDAQQGHRIQYAFDFSRLPPGNPGFPPPPTAPLPSDPVFFALYPPPATAKYISRLAWYFHDKDRLTGVPVGQERFHVTLHPVGHYADLSPKALTAIGKAAATVRMPPFVATFDRAMSFAGKRKLPLVLLGD
jgi:2'-5' RNA ligase